MHLKFRVSIVDKKEKKIKNLALEGLSIVNWKLINNGTNYIIYFWFPWNRTQVWVFWVDFFKIQTWFKNLPKFKIIIFLTVANNRIHVKFIIDFISLGDKIHLKSIINGD